MERALFCRPAAMARGRFQVHTEAEISMSFPTDDILVAARSLIDVLSARGAGDPAKILLEGVHAVVGLGGWTLFLGAVATVRTIYGSQLLTEERRVLEELYDAVYAAALPARRSI